MACCGKKLPHAAPAGQLYRSGLFLKASAWARKHGDAWLILSAKHHVVGPQVVLEPYDLSLDGLTAAQRRAWDERVRDFLNPSHTYTVLAGQKYCGWMTERYEVDRPLAGMGIGEQLAWLKNNT